MPDIALVPRRVDFLTDRNVAVSARRVFVEPRFVTTTGMRVPYRCILDTGAPFSVLPYTLWHGRNLQWNFLGTQLSKQGNHLPEKLDWHGVPCTLAETSAHLIDSQGALLGPFLTVAKLASRRQPTTQLESMALFGMNFLADNDLQVVLKAMGGNVVGHLSVS